MATTAPVAPVPTAELVPSAPTTVIDRGHNLATSEVIQRTKQIREIMEKVMKPNIHYGIIPGTQKPTLYQPGADILNVTFRIAPIVALVDDLSDPDSVRYRITVRGEHQVTKETLAEGVGSCSSNEEKYRWRKPVCDEEFNETPENQRRQKWRRGKNNNTWKEKQIRTSPVDVDNTILKMAVKRAKIAMTLNATAAGDVFGQDLEDLSEELRESLAEEGVAQDLPKPAPRVSEQQKTTGTPTPTPPPQGSTPPAQTAKPAPPAAAPKPSHIGIITKVEERGNAIVVTLDTGFKFSTREAEHMQSIGRLRDTGRRIECLTRPSSDPSKFAPVLTGIEFPVEEKQP